MLLKSEEKLLQWLGHAQRMGRRVIMGRPLELKFKGKRDMGPPRTRYWKISRSDKRAVKKLKSNYYGKKEGTGNVSSCNPCKMETMQ